MEDAVKKIRSVLISTKGRVDIRELQHDYRVLIGEDVPYKKLGFPNLEQMLRKAPTLKIHDGPKNQVFVEALPLDTSVHMSQLISKQKTAKKRGGRLPFRHYNPNRYSRIPRFSTEQSNFPPSKQTWRAPIVNKSRLRPYMHQIVVQNMKSENSAQDRLRKKNTTPELSPNSISDSSTPISESSSRKLQGLVRSVSTPNTIINTSSYHQPAEKNSPISPSYTARPAMPIKDCAPNSRPRMRTHNSFTGSSSMQSPQLTVNIARFPGPNTVRQISNETPPYNSPKSSPSSPNAISSPTYQNKTEAFALLRMFLKEQGLGEPVVKLKRFCKKDGFFYACVIQFDSKSFSSYPADCKTPDQAEKIASEMTLEALTKQNKKKSLLYSTEQDVLLRIPPIIECHFGGLISNQINLDYQEKYEELLPANWVALLDTLPTISVEPIIDGVFILKVCKMGEKNSASNSATTPRQVLSEISIPSNKVHLQPDGWLVQITYISSTIEVWCRRLDIEESEQYVDMSEKMQAHYTSNGWAEVATNVAVGGFYVVPYEGCWSRVRVLNVGEDVSCFFLDYGDEHVVPRSSMHVLKREFAKAQAQAFVCRLAGLEELASLSSGDKHLIKLIDSTFLAKPQLDVQEDAERGASAIPIFLYNVDENVSPADSDVNLSLMYQIVGGITPTLDEDNINLVHVSHVTDLGNVYVQLQGEFITKLNELISALNSVDFSVDLPGKHIPVENTNDAKILYLYQMNGKYYRAKVTDRSPDGQLVCLYLIDVGCSEIIRLDEQKNVYPLDRISNVLCAFSPQAIRIQLDLDITAEEGANFSTKMMTLIPKDQAVLLKVLRQKTASDGTTIPVCELFRRSESRNELFSVNASLKYKEDLREVIEDSNNNSDRNTELAKKLERLSLINQVDNGSKPVPSTGNLAAPKLPTSGNYFDVRIPVAVSPYNFFVQPYETAGELSHLMVKLQLRYNKSRNECLQIEEVIPGNIYASKYNDGNWYRTSVIKVINAGSISVFYCDYGYYDNLTVKQLVPLSEEYLSLPYQAIKARLAGIQPRDEKWSMDDCKHFERLVSDKTFVSIVVTVQKDILYQCDSILILKLIDTSGREDVHIDKLLVQQGIAKEDPKLFN